MHPTSHTERLNLARSRVAPLNMTLMARHSHAESAKIIEGWKICVWAAICKKVAHPSFGMIPTFQNKKKIPKKFPKKIFQKILKSRCHTKRRAGAAPRARPFFGMTTTQDIRDFFASRSPFMKANSWVTVLWITNMFYYRLQASWSREIMHLVASVGLSVRLCLCLSELSCVNRLWTGCGRSAFNYIRNP